MKINYPKIKKILQICVFSLNLLIFIIVSFCTDSSSKKYKEYTGSSVFFLDIYIILIHAALITISIVPKFLFFRIKKYILFIFTDKGKVITSYLISLIYWFAKNKPQFILGVLLTLTSTILLIYEFIFYFSKVENFLSKKGIEFDDKDKPTFDFDILEKNPAVNNTPLSKNNPGPYTANEKSSGDKEVRDVEVTDSYEVDKDKKDKEGEKHDGGFGF